MSASPIVRRARIDPKLSAVLTDLRPLLYSDGGSLSEDRPAHVRAASAVRRYRDRLVIVQDDVNVLAVHAIAAGTKALLLPVGPAGRRTFDEQTGNKKAKMDLEACARFDDRRLVAFGSGSTPSREMLVVVEDLSSARVVDASALYGLLRAETQFAGAELNIEGAVVVEDSLRLFQRGNGSPRGGLSPVSATGDLPLEDFLRWLDANGPVPPLRNVVVYDLGSLNGTLFGFTDATLLPDGAIAFIACAEASPDAVRDGPVYGCRFGIIAASDVRAADVVDDSGRAVSSKIEGIDTRLDDAASFDVVIDMDDPTLAAQLGCIRIKVT